MRLFILFIGSLFLNISALSQEHQLLSGEWLNGSQYATWNSITGKRSLVLHVDFKDEDTPASLREQSVIELVTQHLLVKAGQDGFNHAKLVEKGTELKIGIFSTSTATKEWEFERSSGWQWRQTSGDDVTWAMKTLPVSKRDGLQLLYPDNLTVLELGDGSKRAYAYLVVPDGVSFEEATVELADAVRSATNCDGALAEAPKHLEDNDIDAVSFFAFPEIPKNGLHMVPHLKFSWPRMDGEFKCTRTGMLDTMKNIDFSQIQTWDDIG